MNLVFIAAFIAVCGAAKLDRTYLPPPSAATAGGPPGSLQTPLTRSNNQESSENLPTGSFTNSFDGVVVDAASAGTRASLGEQLSGLGEPRPSYGSINSKVGEAAFRGSLTGFEAPFSSGLNEVSQDSDNKSERPQAAKDRSSNIIAYENDVSSDNYSYGFETDNGIAVGENGVVNNGVQAQGGYSYQGDDGKVYKVTYTADEGGYRPVGSHLPTPPPIPEEILKSLEKNAQEEAAGLVDDGSYDARKYNAEGDYTRHNSGGIQHNGGQLSQFGKRPESDATASNSFNNQNDQPFIRPGQINAQSNQFNKNRAPSDFDSGNQQNVFSGSQNEQSSPTLSSFSSEYTFSNGSSYSEQPGQNSGQLNTQTNSNSFQFGTNQGNFESQTKHFGVQNSQKVSGSGFQGKSQFQLQSNQQAALQKNNYQVQPGVAQTQFGSQNRPLSISYGLNKPISSSQTSANQASSLSGNNFLTFGLNPNRFGGNEYLPPFKANNRPINKPVFSQSSSTSAFASVAQPSFNSQASFNTFQTQTPNKLSQFNQNINTQDKPQGQTQTEEETDRQKSNDFSLRIKSTSVPDTELTTPLEGNEKLSFDRDLQSSSQIIQPFNDIDSPSTNNQAQAQINYQISDGAAPLNNNNLTPTFPTAQPQITSSQFIVPSPTQAAAFLVNQNLHKSQFPQNSFNQNQQSIVYSTPKPFSQGVYDSYSYNHPAKPFTTPVARPQGSRFPSAPSNRFDGLAQSIQNSRFPNQQFPSQASVEPTSPQVTQTQDSANNYSGITQAAISPFPSVSPTTSAQAKTTQAQRIVSQPNYSQSTPEPSLFERQPSSFSNQKQYDQSSVNENISETNSQNEPTTLTQQYEGTIYEYNKPPEALLAPEQPVISSEQNLQTTFSSNAEENQLKENPQPSQESKPLFSAQAEFGQNTLPSKIQENNQGSRPLFDAQALNTFAQSTNVLGQNLQDGNQRGSSQQESRFGFQPMKPFGQLNNNQYSQTSQSGRNQKLSSPIGSQFYSQPSQLSSSSQFNQQQGLFSTFRQNSQGTQPQPYKTIDSNRRTNAPIKSSLPESQFDSRSQPPRNRFMQNTQQTFQNVKSSQLINQPQANIPTKSFGSAGLFPRPIPQIGQNTNQQFGEPHNSQFVSSDPNQQFIQNQNISPSKPFGSFLSQNQFSQTSAQASRLATPQLQGAYKPFSSSNQVTRITQNQNEAQFSQNHQLPSLKAIESAQAQSFGVQNSQALAATGSQVPKIQPEPAAQGLCCQGSTGSSIVPLNVGKPSQAFAQTQSQFQRKQPNAQSVTSIGEEFGGPRQPPSFDQSGYHY